ncbi:hypothetical protein [Streptomyces cinerochromogenes]|uniref:hypothetical protein n=1 Tax=Streptomyces cinerochromogenes TaxID=66422 RepID=UPI0016711735|nr:hypothetical protein [Streptomyces cinerochromogenes]GGS57646.1 hypothetical protein GCM10010206_19200 [Streptomyces cinerochromogenes]
MTPRLRHRLHCVPLLVALTTAALPAYGTAVAYGGPPARVTEPGSARPSATGHRDQRPDEDTARAEAAREDTAPSRGQPEPEASEQSPPGRDGPDQAHATPAAPAHQASPAAVPMPSDSASASVRPYRPLASVEPSRAGSRAGEGRMRPGRPDGPAAEVEGDDDPPPATPVARPEEPEEPETAEIPGASSPSGEARLDPDGRPAEPAAQQAAQQGEAPTEPVLRILPLGSGLVLIGLGLGLALLGLRLRRS